LCRPVDGHVIVSQLGSATFTLITSELPSGSLGDGVSLTTSLNSNSTGGYAQVISSTGSAGVFSGTINTESANSYGVAGVLTFELTGLADNTLYNIAGYAGRDATIFSTNDGTAAPSQGGYTQSPAYTVGANVVELQGTTNGSGDLFITATGDPNSNDTGSTGYSSVSALGISEVVSAPEPRPWELMLVGLAGLIGWRPRCFFNTRS
jgi:hypothetical protein